MLLRAMAQLRLGRMSDAAQQLATLAGAASGHAYAGWASRAAEVARQPRGKRYALLIGVDEVKSLHEQLAAVRHDIAAMKRLFESVLEFEPGNVTVLVGRDATRGAIEAAFQHHVRATGPEDSFVCYFSGKGLLNRGVAVYSSYDVDLSAGIQWTEHDCDSAMRSIAARDKLLITDGCHLAPTSLDERAYRFLFGCRRDEMGWEEHDADGTPRGVFTSALERAVHALGNASVERIVAHVTAGLTGGQLPPQTPGYTGSGSSHLIDRRHASLELIELAEQSHRRFSAEQLDDFTYWLAKDQGRSASMAPLWLAVGHARLAKHSYEAAIDAFERSRHPAAWLPLVRAELCCGRYAAAFLHWRQWHADHAQSMSDTGAAMLASDLQALLEHIHASTRRALIVVTDLDGDRELLQQVSLLQRALKDRWSMRPGDIKLVMNASKDAVLADFEGFARAAGEAPALFLFVGPGFDGPELWLSTAGQADLLADLCLAELRERATGCLNLTSAIVLTKICSPIHDAPLPGWSTPARPPPLGRGTLVAVPHDHREFDVPATPPDLAGLVGALTTPGKFPFTLKDWLGRVRPAHGLSIRGNGDAALLSYHEAGNRALELVRDIEQLPLHRLLALLAGLADHAEFGDDARLHLAIIRWQLGRHKDALGDVDVVLKRQQSTATPGVDAQGPSATARRSEAHYWHGRILLDLRRFAEAEHEFAIVVQLDPEHARAHRHRAEAIQRLIETDLERLLQDSIQHYLRLGAPLGMDDELLQRRTPARAK
jgi:tetratricopeptide (TPR) repeat protein